MNLSTIANKTMSSREIAYLCEKQHGHVMRDIENMNATYDSMGLSKVGEGYYTHPSTGNQQHREFLLTQEQTLDLITGYRADLRIKINRRWAELESQVSAPVLPQSFAEALQLAANQAKALELAQPKINHYNRVVERKALLNATQVAQKLGLSAQRLNKMLDAAHVYNRSVKRSRVFNTWFIDKGLGEIKQTQDGYTQALFTIKGEAWAIEHFSMEAV